MMGNSKMMGPLSMLICFATLHQVSCVSKIPRADGTSRSVSGSACSPVYGRDATSGVLVDQMAGFQCLYVSGSGAISWNRNGQGTHIEVAGSPRVSNSSLMTAAIVVGRMVRHMSRGVFVRVASRGSVGIFALDEKLTVFPEFAAQRNGNCGHSCSGECHVTCSFDGRKWDTIHGAVSRRAVALEDNVICGPSDPHRGSMSILVHEMGHLVHRVGMTSVQKGLLQHAYDQAVKNTVWNPSSYAMATLGEYVATATSVYFNANRDDVIVTGGFNSCRPGGRMCQTEPEARSHLNKTDPLLFNILVQVFNEHGNSVPSGVSICPKNYPIN